MKTRIEKIANKLYNVNENLLLILCGVFTAICVNMITTILTSHIQGYSTFFYFASDILSVITTYYFCKFTFLCLEIEKEILKKGDSKHPEGYQNLKTQQYKDNKEKLYKNIKFAIFFAFATFLFLMIGFVINNLTWVITNTQCCYCKLTKLVIWLVSQF